MVSGEFDDYDIALMRKMYTYRYIGARHTDKISATRGFPRHKGREVKRSIRKLVRMNLIIVKLSTGQKHISLNPRMIGIIREIIK
jgi:hypothetical protein